jgi:hypothetical protein
LCLVAIIPLELDLLGVLDLAGRCRVPGVELALREPDALLLAGLRVRVDAEGLVVHLHGALHQLLYVRQVHLHGRLRVWRQHHRARALLGILLG